LNEKKAAASVFVSYCHVDTSRVQPLVCELRREFDSVFDYLDGYNPREKRWRKRIFRELGRADTFVPIISQAYEDSPFCMLELQRWSSGRRWPDRALPAVTRFAGARIGRPAPRGRRSPRKRKRTDPLIIPVILSDSTLDLPAALEWEDDVAASELARQVVGARLAHLSGNPPS
jgi:hypothetical protein